MCRRLQTIPGVSLRGATAFLGSVGDVGSFRNARRFTCWVGLTPRESSSGSHRHLGRFSRLRCLSIWPRASLVRKASDLSKIEITPTGLGLHWPRLDADLYLPALMEGVFGSRRWMARVMGKAGGRSTSSAKQSAARVNGRLGGRPRKIEHA